MASANIANSAANADSGLELRVYQADAIYIRRRSYPKAVFRLTGSVTLVD